MTIEDPLLSAHGHQLFSIVTSHSLVITGNFMFQIYFEMFYSLCVVENL